MYLLKEITSIMQWLHNFALWVLVLFKLKCLLSDVVCFYNVLYLSSYITANDDTHSISILYAILLYKLIDIWNDLESFLVFTHTKQLYLLWMNSVWCFSFQRLHRLTLIHKPPLHLSSWLYALHSFVGHVYILPMFKSTIYIHSQWWKLCLWSYK